MTGGKNQVSDVGILKIVNDRTIVPNLNGDKSENTFCTNKIKTSRYTIWSFLPLTFLLQFTKIGNCIWLCVLILNYIPAISINGPAVVTAVLSIIIIIGITKEGITDYVRY